MFTQFYILAYLWSRPGGTASSVDAQAFAGNPPDYAAGLTTLINDGLVVADASTPPILALANGVTEQTIVARAASLSAAEQEAVVVIMQAAAFVPGATETFLADNRTAGYVAADAAHSAFFARLSAAVAGRRSKLALYPLVGRSATLADRLGAAL